MPASGHKCARCWNFMPEVSDYGIWQNVCTRCQAALKEMGIDPPSQSGRRPMSNRSVPHSSRLIAMS